MDESNGAEDNNTKILGAMVSGPFSSGNFVDDVENGVVSQITQQDANWSIQSCRYESPTHSWHMGQTDCTGIPIDGGTYSLVYSLDVGPYAILGSAQFYHTFSAYYSSGGAYTDAIYFEVDPTGSGSWTTVASWQAKDSAWSTMTLAGPYDLSSYSAGVTGIAGFRFRFTGGASWTIKGQNSVAGWNVDDFQVSYTAYSSCATVNSVKPVPDGKWVSGTAMQATKAAADGSRINLTWDVATCQNANYNFYYGNGSDVSTYALQGSDCGLGNTGAANGVGIPSVPAGQTFIGGYRRNGRCADRKLLGKGLSGNERHPAASGECGFTAKSTATSCP